MCNYPNVNKIVDALTFLFFLFESQVARLDNTTNQKYDTIEELDNKCLVLLDSTVDQFETLFLTVSTNDEDVDKVKCLDDDVSFV